MTAAAIIISVLLLFLLLRMGIIAQYNKDGIALWLKIAFLKIRINLDEDKAKKKRKPKRTVKIGDVKPGSFREFKQLLGVIKQVLGRLRRRLLIKKLVIYYTSAGDDAAKTALGFGAANAVYSTLIPVLERNFRIKRRDLRATADFSSSEPSVYLLLNISMAVWEGIYILSAVLPVFSKMSAKTQNRAQQFQQ